MLIWKEGLDFRDNNSVREWMREEKYDDSEVLLLLLLYIWKKMLYIDEVKNSGVVVGLRVRMSSYRHEVSYESPFSKHTPHRT